jgi:hypothetical protein
MVFGDTCRIGQREKDAGRAVRAQKACRPVTYICINPTSGLFRESIVMRNRQVSWLVTVFIVLPAFWQ